MGAQILQMFGLPKNSSLAKFHMQQVGSTNIRRNITKFSSPGRSGARNLCTASFV